jgi:hypothetical protein
MSDEVLVEELRTAMRAEVDNIEVAPAVLTRVLESTPRPRLGLGWLMPALAVGVAVIVAVVAVTSLTHHGVGSQGASSRVPSAARGLAARLAVLRRPQRPADVLPHWAVRETESLTHTAGVIGGLSRLVGAVHMGQYGRARVYLVVQRPPRFPLHTNHPEPPLLSPRLGDQVTLAFVGPFREEAAINGPTVAAGGETAAATSRGLTADPGQFTELWGAVASIVPDGVVRVKWVFGEEVAGKRAPTVTVWPRVRDNVALGRVPARLQIYMSTAIWYGAGGRVISRFGIPSPSASARKFKRALEASLHQTIDPALVQHFGVLRGTRVPAYPGLGRAQAASLIEPNPLSLNIGWERFVGDATGPAKVIVIPGRQGIALRALSPEIGQAEAGTSAALAGTLLLEGPRMAGHRAIVGLAPDGNRAVRVLLRDGLVMAVPVVDNVYATIVPASARTLILRNAAGRKVRLRLA